MEDKDPEIDKIIKLVNRSRNYFYKYWLYREIDYFHKFLDTTQSIKLRLARLKISPKPEELKRKPRIRLDFYDDVSNEANEDEEPEP